MLNSFQKKKEKKEQEERFWTPIYDNHSEIKRDRKNEMLNDFSQVKESSINITHGIKRYVFYINWTFG